MAIYGPCSISLTFQEISLLFSALIECQSLPWTRVFPGVTDRNWNLVEFFWYFKLLRLTDAPKTAVFVAAGCDAEDISACDMQNTHGPSG
jgi:hypothetical protein